MGLSSQHMRLSSYLPSELVEAYNSVGMTYDLYQWQVRTLGALLNLDAALICMCIKLQQASRCGLVQRNPWQSADIADTPINWRLFSVVGMHVPMV